MGSSASGLGREYRVRSVWGVGRGSSHSDRDLRWRSSTDSDGDRGREGRREGVRTCQAMGTAQVRKHVRHWNDMHA